MKGNVFWEHDFIENPSFRTVDILKLVRKSSPSHQRVTDYRNSSGKRYERVKKNLQDQIRATNSDLRRNRLLGFDVSWYTEIVLENVINGSKNLPGTLKFARKLSSGHQRITVHRNSTQKRAQRVGKSPRYSQICEEVISWAWSYRPTPK